MSGRPGISYLICSTPRSGSTLLCEALAATGVAGRPEEYFQELESTGFARTLEDYMEGLEADVLRRIEDRATCCPEISLYDARRFDEFDRYLAWVFETGTTANGVFAAKIMWPYLGGLLLRLSGETMSRGRRYDVLHKTFPNLKHVWLRRRDKPRQAVSLWRAVQTGIWRRDKASGGGSANGHPCPPLRFSFDAIDHLRRRLDEEDACWEDYFLAEGVEPLMLLYEDIVDAHGEAVRDILSHIGVEPPTGTSMRPPGTAKQADDLSERWVSRYEQMAAESQPSVA